MHVHMCVHKVTRAYGSLHTGTYTDNYRWHKVLPCAVDRHTGLSLSVPQWKHPIGSLGSWKT